MPITLKEGNITVPQTGLQASIPGLQVKHKLEGHAKFESGLCSRQLRACWTLGWARAPQNYLQLPRRRMPWASIPW